MRSATPPLTMVAVAMEKAHWKNLQRDNHPSPEFGIAIGPPHTGSPEPFGPGTPEESEKSPEKSTPRPRPHKVPKECAPESQKSPKSLVLDSFRTLLRLRGALFGDSWGPGLGCSFRTLFGLFRGSGPEGLGRPCVGQGQSQVW